MREDAPDLEPCALDDQPAQHAPACQTADVGLRQPQLLRRLMDRDVDAALDCKVRTIDLIYYRGRCHLVCQPVDLHSSLKI